MSVKTWLKTFTNYLKTSKGKDGAESRQELKEEIEFHLTASADDHRNAGYSVDESRELAMQRFGDISQVLRECGDVVTASQLFWHRLHIATTAMLLLLTGTLICQTVFDANERPVKAIAATGYSTVATSGDIRGSVTDESGKAVESAHVMAVVKTWPPNGYRQQSYMTTTTPDGSFAIDDVYSPAHDYEIQIAAIADDRLLTSQYTEMTKGVLKPYRIQLGSTLPFQIKFESNDGEPIEGVRAFPSMRIDGQGNTHQVYAMGADPIIRESNMDGRLEMPHFLPGEHAVVSFQFPEGHWQQRELVIPESENVLVLRPNSASRNANRRF